MQDPQPTEQQQPQTNMEIDQIQPPAPEQENGSKEPYAEQSERNSEVILRGGANEEGGEDEMTEPAGEGEDNVEYTSDKDDPMRNGEAKIQRKQSIQSPMKGSNNLDSSAEGVPELKISRKESLKELRGSRTRLASSKLSGSVALLKRKSSTHHQHENKRLRSGAQISTSELQQSKQQAYKPKIQKSVMQ